MRIRHSRHTYSSLLRTTGADIKVMQELLRHTSSRVILDTYTQAVTLHKRKLKVMSFGCSMLLVLVAAEQQLLLLCLFVPSRTG